MPPRLRSSLQLIAIVLAAAMTGALATKPLLAWLIDAPALSTAMLIAAMVMRVRAGLVMVCSSSLFGCVWLL